MKASKPQAGGSPYDFADPMAEFERLTARITERRRAIDRHRIEIGIDLFLSGPASAPRASWRGWPAATPPQLSSCWPGPTS